MGKMSRGGGWGLQRMTAFVLTIGLEAGLWKDGQVNQEQKQRVEDLMSGEFSHVQNGCVLKSIA